MDVIIKWIRSVVSCLFMIRFELKYLLQYPRVYSMYWTSSYLLTITYISPKIGSVDEVVEISSGDGFTWVIKFRSNMGLGMHRSRQNVRFTM